MFKPLSGLKGRSRMKVYEVWKGVRAGAQVAGILADGSLLN